MCSELLATKDDEEVWRIVVELREALRLHIERMRERFGAYPFLVERRARNDTSPVNEKSQEDATKKTSPRGART